ncbi:MAG: hypothetical protein ACRDZ2_04325 [Ilumatobacteraceae bacterium]
MVWSGAADERVRAEAEPADRPPTQLQALVGRILGSRTLIFVLVGAALFVLARSIQEPGHSWGDDFALYINQARGLSEGTAATVVADTRFAIDNSAYASFSPTAYPWGFPALLSAVVATGGIDYAALKLIPTLSFVGGVLVLYLLLEHRLSKLGAGAVAAFFGLNFWYLGRTDQVLSDLTFWFLVVLTLYVLDRRVRAGTLLAGNGALAAAICAFAAFNVRREGVLLLGAIGAAQLVAWLVARRTARTSEVSTGPTWRAALLPYAAFAVGAVVMQLARPAPILNPSQDVGESGLQHVWFNLQYYRDPFAELIGLKDAGPNDLTLLGSVGAAFAAMALVLGLAVVGIVVSLIRTPERDAHLVVALALIGLAVLTQPFREGRYLITLVPLIVYFTLHGVGALLGLVARGRQLAPVRAVVPTLLLLPMFLSVLDDTKHAFDYHRTYEVVSWGPDAPDAQGLFAAVETYTDARDVVVFFQARTMNLYTRRRAIQGNSIPMMVERGDWYAMSRDSDYIQTPLTDAQAAELGFEKVWENPSFVLWKIPDRPAPPALVVPAGAT